MHSSLRDQQHNQNKTGFEKGKTTFFKSEYIMSRTNGSRDCYGEAIRTTDEPWSQLYSSNRSSAV